MSVSEGCDYRDTLGLEPWRNPLSAISQVDGSAPSQFWIFQYRNASSGTWTTTSYTYDAAGNRNGTGYVCDNLNRMTTAVGNTRTYDLLGNTLTREGSTLSWDWANRLGGISTGLGSQSYEYRPDGLRIMRLVDANTATLNDDFSAWTEEITSQTVASPTYRYFYDGQNVHEDDYARVWTINESPYDYHDINRYGLGARGIDWFERYSRRDETATYSTAFPLYDGHGNNIATLKRASSESFTLSGMRFYNAWGGNRSGTHDLDTRYCASIGHRYDNESDLIYMRARYCDPSVGRFISQDPAISGQNWFSYGENDPINSSDVTGLSPLSFKQLYYWRTEWATNLQNSSSFKAQAIPFLALWTVWLVAEAVHAPHELIFNSQKYAFVTDLSWLTASAGQGGALFAESIAGKILNFYEGRALLFSISLYIFDLL